MLCLPSTTITTIITAVVAIAIVAVATAVIVPAGCEQRAIVPVHGDGSGVEETRVRHRHRRAGQLGV